MTKHVIRNDWSETKYDISNDWSEIFEEEKLVIGSGDGYTFVSHRGTNVMVPNSIDPIETEESKENLLFGIAYAEVPHGDYVLDGIGRKRLPIPGTYQGSVGVNQVYSFSRILPENPTIENMELEARERWLN